MYKSKVTINRESITECITPAMRNYRNMLITTGVLLFICLFYLSYIGSIFYIAAVVGGVTVFVLYTLAYIQNKKKSVTNLMNQLNTIYHKDSIEQEIVLESDRIVSHIEDRERELLLVDLKKRYETQNYIMLIFNGNVFAYIDKRTIEGGTLDDVKQYLKMK